MKNITSVKPETALLFKSIIIIINIIKSIIFLNPNLKFYAYFNTFWNKIQPENDQIVVFVAGLR